MSLFDFDITSSKKRKSDTNIHGDEAKKKKNNKKAYEEKHERRYLGDIWEKNMYFLKHLTGNQMANRTPKHGYDMMKSHKKCTAYCVRSFQR